jgi:hypothetical protein
MIFSRRASRSCDEGVYFQPSMLHELKQPHITGIGLLQAKNKIILRETITGYKQNIFPFSHENLKKIHITTSHMFTFLINNIRKYHFFKSLFIIKIQSTISLM